MTNLLRKSTTVAFRVDASQDGLLGELDSRGDKRGNVSRRDLLRYYELMREALKHVVLSHDEVRLLTDIDLANIGDHRLLWAAADDAIARDDLATVHNIEDAEAFVARLRELSGEATCAVVDALERFDRAYSAGGVQAEPLLRSLGL